MLHIKKKTVENHLNLALKELRTALPASVFLFIAFFWAPLLMLVLTENQPSFAQSSDFTEIWQNYCQNVLPNQIFLRSFGETFNKLCHSSEGKKRELNLNTGTRIQVLSQTR